MLRKLLLSDGSWSTTILRLTIGLVMFPHAMQKLLGWFGGPGFSAQVDMFTHNGMPTIVAVLAIVAEVTGSLGLITGFLSRIAAFNTALIMLGAIVMVHLPNGFFMNWMGNQKGEGFEYHILVLGACLVLMIRGGGRASVDEFIAR